MKKALFSLAALIVSSYNFSAADNRIQMPPAETIRASLSNGLYPELINVGLHTDLGGRLLTPGQVIAHINTALTKADPRNKNIEINHGYISFLCSLGMTQESQGLIMAAAVRGVHQ